MRIKYSVKTLDEIIRYWIEATHINNQIDMIVEDADEVGEAYEFAEWMDGDPNGNSIMGVVDCLEAASAKAATVMFNAEKKLKAILDLAIENGDERLSKYRGTAYKDKLDYVMERMYERFSDIYDYNMQEQMENFYNVLVDIMDDVAEK